MSFTTIALSYTIALLIGMLAMVELGRMLGLRHRKRDPDGIRAGAGPVEGAAFGLYGLLIAFTFSGAATRFDQRRSLVVEEANAIGTAYLRLDLLAPEARAGLQERFRNYLDSRLAVYQRLPDIEASKIELERSTAMQGEIWSDAIKACEGSNTRSVLLLPALNSMIDLTTSRTAATLMHPPPVITAMLLSFSLGCALLVGYSMASARSFNWLHTLAFVLITSTTVYVIFDLEYPRAGLIQVKDFDRVLVDLRASMK